MGRDRSYSRSSIISQVQVTVETATKAISTPLCSPLPILGAREEVVNETLLPGAVRDGGQTDPTRGLESKRTSADSGFDNSPEMLGGLQSALLGVEEVRSPKAMVQRPFPLGSIDRMPSCPADFDMSTDRPVPAAVQPERMPIRRALTSPVTSITSTGSTVSMPSLTVRRRLQSNGSSMLLGRAAGLDLRLERQESDSGKQSDGLQRIVELVMENKLERMPDRACGHDFGTQSPTQSID